jgi:sugar phosphate permease
LKPHTREYCCLTVIIAIRESSRLTFRTISRPGIIYLLSFFYLRNEVGFRCGLFASAAPLASTFAGALAYGITNGRAALANWRLLFLVEGLATLVLVPFAFFFTPDSPDAARFLNSEEKKIVKARNVRQVGHAERWGSLNIKEILTTAVDISAWCTAVGQALLCSPAVGS